MRLIKFLNEDDSLYDEFVDKIKNECSDIIDFYTNNNIYLYRGDGETRPNIFKEKVMKNRKPRDSIELFHNYINVGFQSAFNKKIRSEALFCTGSISDTKTYGDCFVIFPTNNFDVYWSSKIHDIADYPWLKKMIKENTSDNITAFLLVRILTYYTFHSDDFFDLLETKFKPIFENVGLNIQEVKEKLVFSRSSVKRDYMIDIASKIINKYKNSSSEFIKKYYEKGNLKEAIKSKSELMITCDDYYACSINLFRKSFKNKLIQQGN